MPLPDFTQLGSGGAGWGSNLESLAESPGSSHNTNFLLRPFVILCFPFPWQPHGFALSSLFTGEKSKSPKHCVTVLKPLAKQNGHWH